ncbi:MAG: hypothetical protein ABID67_01580 [Candidatus Nealsonbacteria bacterium]
MKIVICGSATASKKMIQMRDSLRDIKHEVIAPKHIEEYVLMETSEHIHNESVKNKIDQDLIRDYYNEIKNSDAILVINEMRHNINNYIGGNSFLEIGFAYILNKKIFLLNPIPNIGYKEEIEAMRPIIVNGDLSKIK